MTMYKKIAQEQLQARKCKDTVKASLLTTILGEFARGQTKEEPSDAQVFAALAKFEKGIKDTVALKSTPELETELLIVQELLALKPAGASPEEIRALVIALAAEHPTADMGFFMKNLRAALGDKFDGAIAKQVVTAFLSR